MSKTKDLLAVVEGMDDLAPTEEDIQVAHSAYLIRKETVINELEMLMQTLTSEAQIEIVEDAINFIKEKEF